MILVTVGTTMPFDELLEAIDDLSVRGCLGEPVICQYGQSTYRMKHCDDQFIGRPTLDDLIAASSMVITHGGATVVQLLAANKLFVAFPNPRGSGDHQSSFLAAIARSCNISWSRDVRDLDRLIRERRALGPARLRADSPRAETLIRTAFGLGPAT